MADENWSIVRLFLSVVLCLLPLLAVGAEPDKATIHICDLARNFGAYDGRIAAVRGTYFSGPHGATVAAENCSKPTPFREFGTGIAINLETRLDEGYVAAGSSGQTYAVDRNAIGEFERAAHSGSDERRTTATFIGVLHVKKGFKMHRTPRQGYEGNGYGHMGRYPAELMLTTVRDVVSEPDTGK